MIALELPLDDARIAVFKRDGSVCQYCGTETAPSYIMEHVVPIRMGGPTHLFNLVVACTSCNHSKGCSVWIPANLASITTDHPDWAQHVRALAAECEAEAANDSGRKVHSYKIDPAVGKRLRQLAHARDLPIGHVAEAAFLAYLAEQEAGKA